MSASFPNSPVTGDSYTLQGRTYTYTADGAWKAMVGIGNILAIQVFTADGTYSPSSGMITADIICVGSGASGGGAAASSTGESMGGGGGGGSTSRSLVS